MGSAYQHNYQELFKGLAELVQEPLVLFRQVGEIRCSDVLTAAVPTTTPGRFFVLGTYNDLPGWDPGMQEERDWGGIYEKAAAWIGQMFQQAKAQGVVEYSDNKPKLPCFIQQDRTPKWVFWIEENEGFSNASGLGHMGETYLIAPERQTKRIGSMQRRLDLQRQIQNTRQKLEKSRQSLVSASTAVAQQEANLKALQQQLLLLEQEE